MTKSALPNLLAVIIHACGFALYLHQLYYGAIPQVYVKGCMYVFMATMHLYLVIDEWSGVKCFKQLQFNTVNKSLFIFNFILIGCTIFDICDGVFLMFIYLFAVTLTSLFILNSGIQHDYFKNEDTD